MNASRHLCAWGYFVWAWGAFTREEGKTSPIPLKTTNAVGIGVLRTRALHASPSQERPLRPRPPSVPAAMLRQKEKRDEATHHIETHRPADDCLDSAVTFSGDAIGGMLGGRPRSPGRHGASYRHSHGSTRDLGPNGTIHRNIHTWTHHRHRDTSQSYDGCDSSNHDGRPSQSHNPRACNAGPAGVGTTGSSDHQCKQGPNRDHPSRGSF